MKLTKVVLIAALLLGAALTVRGLAARLGRHEPPVVDRQKREIRFQASVHPAAMERRFGVQGHHAIVWDRGMAARWALFRSFASDMEVRQALREIGLEAGENLTAETWTHRKDNSHPDPEMKVEGSRIEVLVQRPGSPPVPLEQLIADRGAAAHLDLRFGGNERHRDAFRSGCIVCLYSCPGGAIGNRQRTIRDYVREGVVFSARRNMLPPESSTVTIIMRPRQEEP